MPLDRQDSATGLEPAAKKRRVDSSSEQGPKPLQSQPSFADVLEGMKEESGDHAGAEGGADCWARPAPTCNKSSSQKIVFQQIEVEEAVDNRHGRTVIRMFGVTEAGHSVLANVTDFLPYFYVLSPREFTEDDIGPFAVHLNNITIQRGVQSGAVKKLEEVRKRSLMGYRGDEHEYEQFLKITITEPGALTTSGEIKFRDMFSTPVSTYESNITYTSRFMIDIKVVGMNWIEVPPGKYTMNPAAEKCSNCQLEFSMSYDHFISHAPEGEWQNIAPLRILSFDIECNVRGNILPQHWIDPVLQIANMVTRQVLSFNDEATMLQAWRDFVEKVDPDVIIGFNNSFFDLPYLVNRAKVVRASKFPFLGRYKNRRTNTIKRPGQNPSRETPMEGRLQIDLFQYIKREYTALQKLSLNAVCEKFLGEKKEDVDFSQITGLQNGTPETRRRLAIYCLKDAYLPQRLLDKLLGFVKLTEMARVMGVPFSQLLTRDRLITGSTLLYRRANDEDYVIPALSRIDEQGPTVPFDIGDLYPPIIMAHNLCYTTLLDKATIDKLRLVKDKDYIQTSSNESFVKAERRKGILPSVLEDLTTAEEQVKADREKETDPSKQAILDGRQHALKVTTETMYGLTFDKLPCPAISSSVKAYSQKMIAGKK